MASARSANAAEAFRRAMLEPSDWWNIEHVDITCDSCEIEPIVGQRFKCTDCEDIDVCGACYDGDSATPGFGVAHENGAHVFEEVEGPERAIRFLLPPKDAREALAAPLLVEKADEMLRVYLNTFKPSAAACEHVAWICISFCPPLGDLVDGRGSSAELEALHGTAVPGVRDKSEDGEREPAQAETLEDRIDALLEEFEGIEDRQEPLTARLIDQLASRYSVTRGKWMCFPVPHAVDVLWDDLAMALAAGALDPATEIKVAPRSPERQDHAICIYTENYLDQDEVLAVRDRLRAVLPSGTRLFYKPDIYTVLGIYRGNRWGISPSVLVDPG